MLDFKTEGLSNKLISIPKYVEILLWERQH